YTCTNFHKCSKLLFLPVNLISIAEHDSSLSKIVRGHLDIHCITWHQTDIVLSHFTADVSDDTMSVLKFHLKLSIRQCFHNLSSHFDYFFLIRHKLQYMIIHDKLLLVKSNIKKKTLVWLSP